MEKIKVFSPAKINLFLKVLGKRKDGYHDIFSWMQTIDLRDELRISRSRKGIRIACDNPRVPTDTTNLAYQAARRFQQAVQISSGIKIEIKKEIPLGAGLGGGSSNAASVLWGLNQMLGRRLDSAKLFSLAKPLGSDVPFFLTSGSTLAFGRGEKLKPIKLPLNYWLVLVNPGFEVSTKWAYDKTRPGRESPDEVLFLDKITLGQMIKYIKNLGNDLQEVVQKKYPVIKKVVLKLEEQEAVYSAMSGSGPTVFGIFIERLPAQKAEKNLRRITGWKTWLAKPIRSRLSGLDSFNLTAQKK